MGLHDWAFCRCGDGPVDWVGERLGILSGSLRDLGVGCSTQSRTVSSCTVAGRADVGAFRGCFVHDSDVGGKIMFLAHTEPLSEAVSGFYWA